MDLNFTAEETAFRQQIRQWVANHLPQRHPPQGASRAAPDARRPPALGQDPRPARLARLGLAEGAWRARLERRAASPVRRRMCACRCATCAAVRPGDGGAGDHGLRHARAAAPLPARHRQRRCLVEPGLQRTRCGLGPGVAEVQGRAPRRLLPRQRPEDLDHDGPARRLDLLPGAHQQRGQAADRHLVPADRHEEPGCQRAPDRDARRQPRGQRGLVRQRRGSGRPADRRGEQGLELCQVPALARAHQHRRRQPRQARTRAREAHRQGRRVVGRPALSRPDRAARGRHRRAGDDGAARAVGREERQAEPGHRRPAEDPRQRDPAALQRIDDAGRGPVRAAVDQGSDGSRLAGRACRRGALRAAGRRPTSTTARRRSTAAATKFKETSSRRRCSGADDGLRFHRRPTLAARRGAALGRQGLLVRAPSRAGQGRRRHARGVRRVGRTRPWRPGRAQRAWRAGLRRGRGDGGDGGTRPRPCQRTLCRSGAGGTGAACRR